MNPLNTNADNNVRMTESNRPSTSAAAVATAKRHVVIVALVVAVLVGQVCATVDGRPSAHRYTSLHNVLIRSGDGHHRIAPPALAVTAKRFNFGSFSAMPNDHPSRRYIKDLWLRKSANLPSIKGGAAAAGVDGGGDGVGGALGEGVGLEDVPPEAFERLPVDAAETSSGVKTMRYGR